MAMVLFSIAAFENVMGPYTLYSSSVGFTVYAMDRTSTCAACWYLLLDAVCQAESAVRWYLLYPSMGRKV